MLCSLATLPGRKRPCGFSLLHGFDHPGSVFSLSILLHMKVSSQDDMAFLFSSIWSFYCSMRTFYKDHLGSLRDEFNAGGQSLGNECGLDGSIIGTQLRAPWWKFSTFLSLQTNHLWYGFCTFFGCLNSRSVSCRPHQYFQEIYRGLRLPSSRLRSKDAVVSSS